MSQRPLDVLADVEEGDRLIVDIDPEFDQDRGVATLEATERTSGFSSDVGSATVQEVESEQILGRLRQVNGDGPLAIERPGSSMRDATTVASINDIRRTDRRDLDPVGIGRDRNTGRFTPDNVVSAPASPSDRDPDDGEFVTPDPQPITDIGRQRKDGLFDLF